MRMWCRGRRASRIWDYALTRTAALHFACEPTPGHLTDGSPRRRGLDARSHASGTMWMPRMNHWKSTSPYSVSVRGTGRNRNVGAAGMCGLDQDLESLDALGEVDEEADLNLDRIAGDSQGDMGPRAPCQKQWYPATGGTSGYAFCSSGSGLVKVVLHCVDGAGQNGEYRHGECRYSTGINTNSTKACSPGKKVTGYSYPATCTLGGGV